MSPVELYNIYNYALPEETESIAKWYGNSNKNKAAKQSSDIPSNLTKMLLQTGTSELSEPILVQERNTTLAVFLTEDDSRKICYAVWSENTKSFVKAADTLSSTESVSCTSAHAYMDTEGNVAEVGLKNTGADIFGTTGNNVLFMTGKCGDKTIDKEFTLRRGFR